MSPSLRIVFAGTPDFAVPALEALVASRHRVLAVYTQPDRPAGRGRELRASPVKGSAAKHGIPCEQPITLRESAAVEKLASYRPDVMVVVAYGLILPQPVLDVPRLGCVNIHASLLPQWRGAAPIQRAILAGDAYSGVSIMRMDAGLDTGPVLAMYKIPLTPGETAATLHDRLATLGAQNLVTALEGMAEGALVSQPQSSLGVSYAAKIRKEEGLIDWSRPAIEIDRQVRAFNPWPVAETRWAGQQLRIWEAAPIMIASEREPGTVLSASASGILVATGENLLNVTRVQLAGRKAVPAADFANANLIVNQRLGLAT